MEQPDDRSRRAFLKASSMLGLAVAFGPATIGEAFADLKSENRGGPDEPSQCYTARQRAAG